MNCVHFNSATKNTPEYFLLVIVRIIDGVFAPGERQIISFYSYMYLPRSCLKESVFARYRTQTNIAQQITIRSIMLPRIKLRNGSDVAHNLPVML